MTLPIPEGFAPHHTDRTALAHNVTAAVAAAVNGCAFTNAVEPLANQDSGAYGGFHAALARTLYTVYGRPVGEAVMYRWCEGYGGLEYSAENFEDIVIDELSRRETAAHLNVIDECLAKLADAGFVDEVWKVRETIDQEFS